MPHKIEKINANEPDDRPLPLIVAEKWDFKLDYAHLGDNYFYAIQDWVTGLTSSNTRTANRTVAEWRRFWEEIDDDSDWHEESEV